MQITNGGLRPIRSQKSASDQSHLVRMTVEFVFDMTMIIS